ncbi:MAG: helix-turn-helix domain-containing protein, partial [Patescibacteria group bacterium]
MAPLLDSRFISTKEASELSGYNPDYISRLARSGKLEGSQVGRAWFVNKVSLEAFIIQQEERKRELARTLSLSREREYQARVLGGTAVATSTPQKAAPSPVVVPAVVIPAESIAENVLETPEEALREIKTEIVKPVRSPYFSKHFLQQAGVAVIAVLVVSVGAYSAPLLKDTFSGSTLGTHPSQNTAALASAPASTNSFFKTVSDFIHHAFLVEAPTLAERIAGIFWFGTSPVIVIAQPSRTYYIATSTVVATVTSPALETTGFPRGPITQNILNQTIVRGVSKEYVDSYVAQSLENALRDATRIITAAALDGHGPPQSSSSSSGGSLSNSTITSATITGSSFSGTVTASSLTVSGNSNLASTTITGPLTLTGTTTFTGPVVFANITGSTQCLHVDTNGVISGTTLDCGTGGSGISGVRAQYSSYQTGSLQTFATSSDTNIGLTITSAGDIHTFTPSWIGTLAATRGGTGLSSITTNQLLIGGAGNTITQLATSSLGLLTTDVIEGSNLYYTDARVQTYLATLAKSFFFSTSSADYWKTQNDFFSTTSASYFLSQNTGNAYSTTSADYWLTTKTTDNLTQGVTNRYYSDSLVQAFVHGSSTIPKTYSSNTFTAGNTFNGGLTIGTLSGPLVGTAGVVSASSTLTVNVGGTGSTTSLGGILAGNGLGPIKSVVIGSGLTWDGTTLSSNGTTYTGTYPIQVSGSVISTAFSTTTQNNFNLHNTFTSLFATNASTTNATTTTLGIGSLNGPLQATNGVVSATSTLSVVYGGTGISTSP